MRIATRMSFNSSTVALITSVHLVLLWLSLGCPLIRHQKTSVSILCIHPDYLALGD